MQYNLGKQFTQTPPYGISGAYLSYEEDFAFSLPAHARSDCRFRSSYLRQWRFYPGYDQRSDRCCDPRRDDRDCRPGQRLQPYLDLGFAGFYSLGPLQPGPYTISVTAPSFEGLKVTTVVRTGTATSGNEKLTLGSASETIEVNAGQLQINTDQAGVQDVLTKQQVEALPINGRNFLDLAQVQPGVILQSGETFDPTKAGYSAISVDGVSGRTTRILYDGQDITDETVGTTIINVPTGAVDEFQLNRSTQDVSGEVTSTGQVLVSSPSGTNAFHGQAFYQFQDYRAILCATLAASRPVPAQPVRRGRWRSDHQGQALLLRRH